MTGDIHGDNRRERFRKPFLTITHVVVVASADCTILSIVLNNFMYRYNFTREVQVWIM